MDLFDACKHHLLPSADFERDVDRLNWLRNCWTHFAVDGSSHSVRYARLATKAGIRIVRQLYPEGDGLYSSLPEGRCYNLALTSLSQLLAIEELDATGPEVGTEEERWDALIAQYGDDDEA